MTSLASKNAGRVRVDPVHVRILTRLAERNNQLLINSNEAMVSNLTDGEMAAILPNAALVDQRNLLDLSLRDVKTRTDPLGMTDLTNEVNEPTVRVLHHPILSLYNEIGQALVQRNAPQSLCTEVRDLGVLLQEKYLRQLKHQGLPDAWPDFRRDWESAMASAGILNWKRYGPARPNPGCSPEYILDRLAKVNDLKPDFSMLDHVVLRGECIADQIHPAQIDLEVESRYLKNRAIVDAQLERWEAFCNTAHSTFAATVNQPLQARSRAWFYACKDIAAPDIARIRSVKERVAAFASSLPKTESVVLRQAAATAASCVIGTTMEDRLVKGALGASEAVSRGVAAVASRIASDTAVESIAEAGSRVLDTMVLATGLPGALLYFAGKIGLRLAAPQVADAAQDLARKGVGKVTGWVRTSTQNMAYEESRAKESSVYATSLLQDSCISDLPAREILEHLTPVGLRAATMLVSTYDAVTPERVEKAIDYLNSENPTVALSTLGMSLDKRVKTPPPDVAGFHLEFPGSPAENAQAARMSTAAIVETAMDVTGVVNEKVWVKGHRRLHNSLDNAKNLRVHLEALAGEGGDDQFIEEVLHERMLRDLDLKIKQNLVQSGPSFLFTGKAISNLLKASDDHYAKTQMASPPRRADSTDYAVLMVINATLGRDETKLVELKQGLAAIMSFSHMPAFLVPRNLSAARQQLEAIVAAPQNAPPQVP